MVALAARLSECAATQDMNRDPGNAAAALAKIKVCQPTDPWDLESHKFSAAELDELLFQMDLSPGEDEEYVAGVNVGDPEGRCPNTAGAIEVRIVTQILEEDWLDGEGEQDCYLWHCDRVAGLCQQLHLRVDEASKADPQIRRVRRLGKPLWNPEEAVQSQGRHIWSVLVVEYGSRFDNE